MTPTLYLLCGLPGSGKTTHARELEAAGKGIALTADDWVCQLFPDDSEAAARDERKGFVQQVQDELVERLLAAGISVILDHGASRRVERDHYRLLAGGSGAAMELVFLDAPIETLHQRVARRNLDLPPGTFHISVSELDKWSSEFEVPSAEELRGR
jgi:predicted kinase